MEEVVRFISKLRKENDCWLWEAGKDKGGYGKFKLYGETLLAHRVIWIWCKGDIPEHLEINHLCNNPSCCNVDHMELVTRQGNSDYKVIQGRQARGETNGRAKLSNEKVIAIRELYSAGGIGYREIAKRFNISYAMVGNIIRRRNWD